MKKKWIRKVIGGLSLTSALFVFQACYGTPQDLYFDVLIEGQVNAKSSGLPIKGIQVLVADNMQYQITDEEGKFSFYTQRIEPLTLQFADIDSVQNGLFNQKDTVLTNFAEEFYLDILLDEK